MMPKRNVKRFRRAMETRVQELGLRLVPWDIETGMNEQFAYDIWNGTSPKAIKRERYIISSAWKDIGTTKVKSTSVLDDKLRFKKDPRDDYTVVNKTYEALADADLLIAHYGDRFDLPFFNARAIYHGLPPLPDIKTVDTCQIAKRKFKFNSNQLGYLARYLGYESKINTNIDLWLGCMQGKVKSVKEMLTYNKQDINVLTNIYFEFVPYMSTKFNFGLYQADPTVPSCPACGSLSVKRNGDYLTVTTLRTRYACNLCGKSFSGPGKKNAEGKIHRAHYR